MPIPDDSELKRLAQANIFKKSIWPYDVNMSID